jgi:alpha-D-xyloside xylohydrolase
MKDILIRSKKVAALFCGMFLILMDINTYAQDVKSCKPVINRMANGIWKLRFGDPEQFTPETFRAEQPKYEAVNNLNDQNSPPIKFDQIACTVMPRGVVLELPLIDSEEIYGLGLSKYYFGQRGLRKELKTASHDNWGLGAGHAPVPFYISSSGYGVYVDTARYTTFYVGTHGRIKKDDTTSRQHNLATVNEADLYRTEKMQGGTRIYVDIPIVKGVDIYIFAGPQITQVLQRYNLFSGGGCLPPLWGLGLNYEGKGDHDANETLRLAQQIRNDKVPCDYYTFPVAWQSHAYSSSLDWNTKLFSNHTELIAKLNDIGIRPALWEQAYVDAASPLFIELLDQSGNFAVWKGLVPDFGSEKVRKLFGDYHKEKFIDANVFAFKLDECDGDGSIEPFQHWQFPEHTIFPSGIDGEQMQMLLGSLYQRSMYEAFKKANKRTFGNVRASFAMASPYPFAVYSDEYDIKEYIKYNVTSAFTGTLWDPELRHADSFADFNRRLGVMTFSAKMHINGWQVNSPVWRQPNIDKNNAGELLSDNSSYLSVVKRFGQIRMSLIPYLYTAFCRYAYEGIPPVRPMICDYTDDKRFKDISDQWLLGDSLLVAPVLDAQSSRSVILPVGTWYDFWTQQRYDGNQSIRVSSGIGHIPIFVKENTILPLAMPLQYIGDNTIFHIEAVCYGPEPKPCILYEDDGVSYDCLKKNLFNIVTIDKNGKIERTGHFQNERYKIVGVSASLDNLKYESAVTKP